MWSVEPSASADGGVAVRESTDQMLGKDACEKTEKLSWPSSRRGLLLAQMSSALLPATFLDDIHDGSSLPLAAQPNNITVRLYDYQRKALHFMEAREASNQEIRGGILADKDGTTVSATRALTVRGGRCDIYYCIFEKKISNI